MRGKVLVEPELWGAGRHGEVPVDLGVEGFLCISLDVPWAGVTVAAPEAAVAQALVVEGGNGERLGGPARPVADGPSSRSRLIDFGVQRPAAQSKACTRFIKGGRQGGASIDSGAAGLVGMASCCGFARMKHGWCMCGCSGQHCATTAECAALQPPWFVLLVAGCIQCGLSYTVGMADVFNKLDIEGWGGWGGGWGRAC